MLRIRFSLAFLTLFGVLTACDSENSPTTQNTSDTGLTLYPSDSSDLEPRIRRTTAGVPHITGDSLSTVTAGLGFVQAEDNLCVLADGFVKVRGERAEFFGPGPDSANIISDFSYRALELHSTAQANLESTPASIRAMVDGFVSGYNHYLKTSNPDDWPAACRNEPWVREISAVDLLAYYGWLAQLASGANFTTGAILDAVPPNVSTQPVQVGTANTESELTKSVEKALASHSTMRWDKRNQSTASNAWGIGSELSENERGALLANPHFPYTGSNRFYQSHLTIPDELDVNGAGLLGAAIPLIMFNENIAWSHTTSESYRFTVYQLQLDPDNPMAYTSRSRSLNAPCKLKWQTEPIRQPYWSEQSITVNMAPCCQWQRSPVANYLSGEPTTQHSPIAMQTRTSIC